MKNIKALYIAGLLLLMGATGFAQERYTIINYPIGFAMGDTKDFIDKTSFRGFGLEFGKFLADDKVSVGFQTNFQTFYKELPKNTYPIDNGAITGKQYRYITSVPLLVSGLYYPLGQETVIVPHVGLGLGTYYVDKKLDMGLFRDQTKVWHLGLAPQLGVSVPINYKTSFNVNAQYNVALKTKNHDAEGWLTLSFGLKYIY